MEKKANPFCPRFHLVSQIFMHHLLFALTPEKLWPSSVVDKDNKEISSIAVFFYGLPVPTCFAVQQQSSLISQTPTLSKYFPESPHSPSVWDKLTSQTFCT